MPPTRTRVIRRAPVNEVAPCKAVRLTKGQRRIKTTNTTNTTNMGLRTTFSDVQPLPSLWRRELVHQVGLSQFVNRAARLAILYNRCHLVSSV